MLLSEKEHKKLKKQFEEKTNTKTKSFSPNINKKEETLPDWFDKELKNEEMSESEKEELENLLKSIS